MHALAWVTATYIQVDMRDVSQYHHTRDHVISSYLTASSILIGSYCNLFFSFFVGIWISYNRIDKCERLSIKLTCPNIFGQVSPFEGLLQLQSDMLQFEQRVVANINLLFSPFTRQDFIVTLCICNWSIWEGSHKYKFYSKY